jgi:hypothetical protein
MWKEVSIAIFLVIVYYLFTAKNEPLRVANGFIAADIAGGPNDAMPGDVLINKRGEVDKYHLSTFCNGEICVAPVVDDEFEFKSTSYICPPQDNKVLLNFPGSSLLRTRCPQVRSYYSDIMKKQNVLVTLAPSQL